MNRMSSALYVCLSLLREAARDLYLGRLQASITATPLPPPALTLAKRQGSAGSLRGKSESMLARTERGGREGEGEVK